MEKIRFIGDDVPVFGMNEGEEIVEITESWFWHFYECVPPIGYTPCFLVGEAHDHDDEGYARFTLVFSCNGKYYAGQPLRADAKRKAKAMELIEKYELRNR